jgi:hypothetical protein
VEMVHGVGGLEVHRVPWTWFILLRGDLIWDVHLDFDD